MAAPHHPEIKLEMNISLDTLLGAEIEHTEEGPVYSGGVRLGDLVAELLAAKLADQAEKRVRDTMHYGDLRVQIEAAIDRIVEVKLADLVEREVVPTDGFGRAIGEPTTLSQQIMKQAADWFAKPVGDRSSGGSRQTNLEALVAKVIDRKVTAELQQAVRQAVADAKDQVQAVLARLLADEAAKAVSGR